MSEKYSNEKIAYNNQYKRDYYDEMQFEVPKGKKTVISQVAKAKGCSYSQLIIAALESQYDIDLS